MFNYPGQQQQNYKGDKKKKDKNKQKTQGKYPGAQSHQQPYHGAQQPYIPGQHPNMNQPNYHQPNMNQPNYQQHMNQPNYQQHMNQPNYQQHMSQPNYQQPPGMPPPLNAGQVDLSQWFDHFDRDRNGTLEREEVVMGLQHTLASNGNRSDPHVLRDTVYSVWPMFDRDGSGVINRFEFCAPGGLGERLVAMVSPGGGGGERGGHGNMPAPHQPYNTGAPAGYTPTVPVIPTPGNYGQPQHPPQSHGGAGYNSAPSPYVPSTPQFPGNPPQPAYGNVPNPAAAPYQQSMGGGGGGGGGGVPMVQAISVPNPHGGSASPYEGASAPPYNPAAMHNNGQSAPYNPSANYGGGASGSQYGR